MLGVVVSGGVGFRGLSKVWVRGSGYQVLRPRPWPVILSVGVLCFAARFIRFVHGRASLSFWGLWRGVMVGGYRFFMWIIDVVCEATHLGAHTSIVVRGLKLGFWFFMTSEVFFFVGFFWAWFHFGIGNLSIGCSWPPHPLIPINPWGAPLFNTVLLVFSGCVVSWGCEAVALGLRVQGLKCLVVGILAGVLFLVVQFKEYKAASFCIADGAYGRAFYLLTGLHGLHVLGGLLFLRVQALRLYLYHFTGGRRWVGLKFAVWYWHFVDVV